MKTVHTSYLKSTFRFLNNFTRVPTHLERSSSEHDRLDGQSAALVALMNHRPFHATVSQPNKILDIGCGTGAMTNMLASMYPEAHVIGIDIAPVPESRHGKRPNVEYIQGDIRELVGKDPRLEPGSFDYLFQRFMLYGVTEWDVYLKTISTLLRAEGWLEIQEISAQVYSESGDRVFDGERWYEEFFSNAAALGLNIELGDSLKQLVDATPGLIDVHETVYKIATVGRKAAPELVGIEGQILSLFTVIIRKIMSARGKDETYTEQLIEEMKARYEKGFEEGDRHRIPVVVGQKAAP